MSKVSIIIPVYNGAKDIKQTVESAISQTYVDKEVLVINDGSTDDTLKILESFKDKIKIITKLNGGPASARNLGIEKSEGDYISFLDGDDIWMPEKIEKQVELMNANPQAGLVYTLSSNFDKNFNTTDVTAQVKKVHYEGKVFDKLFWHNFVRTSTVMVRKDCFKQCGNFNESQDFFAVEDYDMWLRIAKEYSLIFLSEDLVYYRVHIQGISKNIDRSYKNEKNVIDEAIKRWPDLEQETGVSVKKRFSQLFLTYGADLLEHEQQTEARKKFWISLKYNALNLGALLNYLKTLLPNKVFMYLRAARRREQHVSTT